MRGPSLYGRRSPDYIQLAVPRLKSLALILLVALLVLLPLYEFIDIGEQWPFDGEVVGALLTALLIVASLVVLRQLARVCFAMDRRLRRREPYSRHLPLLFFSRRDRSSLFLVRCHFRI
jgi:hypothetical protein